MALIPCKECGHQVSKTAAACPKCGAKVPHTSSVTKIAVVALFLVLIMMLSNAVLNPTKSTVPQPEGTLANTASEQNLNPSWHYENSQDKMGRGTVKAAIVESTNKVEFGFPYQESQRGTLMLRNHPKHGKNVIFSIEHGQFLCGIESCSVSVRFDAGRPQVYTASEPTDHSTTTLFIENYARFLAGLKKSKRVSIEASFFQEGSRVFEFETTGLNW